MHEDRNQSQIIRKDAKNCFVESLSDAFDKGKLKDYTGIHAVTSVTEPVSVAWVPETSDKWKKHGKETDNI